MVNGKESIMFGFIDRLLFPQRFSEMQAKKKDCVNSFGFIDFFITIDHIFLLWYAFHLKTDGFLKLFREVFELFNENCSKNMAPGKYLTIDETLYPMRNHIGFKTYMANKPASYGINFKSINEAGFPYTYSIVVQAGKPVNEQGGPYYTKGIDSTVQRLVSNLKRFQKIDGRNITTDNL